MSGEIDRGTAERIREPEGGWRTVGREEAARELTGRGVDMDAARAMVTEYLRETSERVGAPVYQWGLDQGDIDAIGRHLAATEHEVDDEAGWSR